MERTYNNTITKQKNMITKIKNWMNRMNNNTITYRQYKNIIGEHKRIRGLGIELIPHRDIFKITIGSMLVGVGIITLPLPTGSLVMIPLGIMMVVSGGVDITKHKHNIQRIIRYKIGRVLRW